MGRYWVPNGHRHLASDEWLTPPWMLDALGPFDLDPCAAVDRPWKTARRHFTVKKDGLSQTWSGRVWVNPPYGKGLSNWITRAAEHGNGLAIFPLRSTDAGWFHDAVWSKAAGVLFVRGRVKFWLPEGIEGGPCPHASLIVAWGKSCAESLRASQINGHFISA